MDKPVIISIEEGKRKILLSQKYFQEIPSKDDYIFYDGKNYKVLYRKFIYLKANGDLDRIIIKVKEI